MSLSLIFLASLIETSRNNCFESIQQTCKVFRLHQESVNQYFDVSVAIVRCNVEMRLAYSPQAFLGFNKRTFSNPSD